MDKIELGKWPQLVTAIDQLILKLEKQRQETNYWKSRAAELERLNSFALHPNAPSEIPASHGKDTEQFNKEKRKLATMVKQILLDVITIENALEHKQEK